jgi:signal transduction histidine kinase
MKSLFLFIFFSLFISEIFSQADNDSIFHISHLPDSGITLNKGWKIQAGDNPEWKIPDYDDKNWKTVDPTQDIHTSVPQIPDTGICWLRLHLSLDSSLLNTRLALIVSQTAATEIFLNGVLIANFGVINDDPKKIKAFNPYLEPVPFRVSANPNQVIGVRFAKQPAILYTTSSGNSNPALRLQINEWSRSVFISNRIYVRYSSSDSFRIGVFFILFILHLAFYLFYRGQKANLYLCLFAFFSMIGGAVGMGINHKVQYMFFVFNFHGATGLLSTFLMLTAVYTLFNEKKRWTFRSLLFMTILSILLNLWPYGWGWLIGVFLTQNLISLEAVRIAFKAVRNKKKGARIIAAGGVCFIASWLLFFAGVPANLFDYTERQLTAIFTIGDLLFNLAWLSIPISTSIYLGLDFAFTNVSLTQKITEIEQLTHEKQQMLISQNEMLENQVRERTASLNHSLDNLKSTQAQLIQSEKMASLGELTAGIAHEIQNPLNFVNNFSDVNTELLKEMKTEIDKGNFSEARSIADNIIDNEEKINNHGKRADSIVKGMLQHSRTSTGQKEPTDINALADEYLRLAYHGLRAKDSSFNATIKTDFDPSIGKINIIPQDIGRVLLNVFNNAFYAVSNRTPQLHKGGVNYEPTVSVSTSLIVPPPGGPRGAEIRISDNGNGIPQKILDKIFQPFFTTKPAGQGTGLGLSLSYDIIKAHGGEIKVETKEGEGSKFIIHLPIG